MEINLTSNVPCYPKPYRTHFALRPVVGNIISELLDSDIIRPSDSSYASGIVVVEKQYCRQNTVSNAKSEGTICPISREFIFFSAGLAFAISSSRGLRIIKQFTAFVTSDGHYEYNWMPFGLVNVPAIFKRS